jgi:hypothetical protein
MKSPRNKAFLMCQTGGDILAVTPQIKNGGKGKTPAPITIFNLNCMPQFNIFFMNLNFLNLGLASLCWPLKNESQLLKYLKCKVPFLLLFLLPIISVGQNLVPNPSFEEYLECPFGTAEFHNQVIDWYSWNESPDFFHTCSNEFVGLAGVPENAWGYQWPMTGEAYAALGTFAHFNPNIREYMAAPLVQELEIGEKYYVFFHASQYDGGVEYDSWCATSNIGIRFFKDPSYSASNPFNPLTPDNFAHINYSEILNDTTNWTKIEGWITADDSYNWVAIGNFFDDSQTQIQELNDENRCFGIYYIENVCVAKTPQECEYLLNQAEISNSLSVITVYPNPVEAHLQVHSNHQKIHEIRVFNAIGQLVFWSNQQENIVKIEAGHWSGGLYILEVKTEDGFIQPFKVLKQ